MKEIDFIEGTVDKIYKVCSGGVTPIPHYVSERVNLSGKDKFILGDPIRMDEMDGRSTLCKIEDSSSQRVTGSDETGPGSGNRHWGITGQGPSI